MFTYKQYIRHTSKVFRNPSLTKPVPVAARSKVLFCGRSPAEIVGSNPTGSWMFAWCECYVLSGRGLCDELITRPEESYRLWKNHHILTGPPVFWRCHTMAHVPLIFLSEWREFPSALCLAGKKNWWQLASSCCWNRARRLTCFFSASVRRKDLQFGTLIDPSFQRHYRFRPMTWRSMSG